MRVADYIVDFIAKRGVKTIFMVPGGQAMFLNDAVYRNKHVVSISVHHEQAAGMAAEAYGRITGNIGVAMVTAGPAAVNVLNGVVGAYVDSAPMMVISGQSASNNVSYMEKTGIRQCGLQGIYTKPIAQSVTKYFVTVDDPGKIAYYMEKAYALARSGRPGPVWVEVPLDIQRMEVPEKQYPYEVEQTPKHIPISSKDIAEVVRLIVSAKHPLLIVGQGVKIAKADALVDTYLRLTQSPVGTCRLGIDLIDSDNELFVGRPGLYGDRPANIAVQIADIIIAVGARLEPGVVGYDAEDWGRNAKIVTVDIDPKELAKPGVRAYLKIQGDAYEFFTLLNKALSKKKLTKPKAFIKHIGFLRKKYPTASLAYAKEKPVNSYFLSERLSALASKHDTIVVDTSSPFHVVSQAWNIKKGQRFLTTGGISTMGYWPAAIGASVAQNRGRTIVVTGDGCFQMNIQELATLKYQQLPIKLFIINNNGYLLIRHTQKIHMEGRLIGESPKTGLWLPDSIKIAKAYGIRCMRIDTPVGIDKKLKAILAGNDPVVVDVVSPHWQQIIPRVSSEKMPDGRLVSKPYEDLYPFLTKVDLARAMTVSNETNA
jgi:acetolactate synthase I/II/III large subunit